MVGCRLVQGGVERDAGAAGPQGLEGRQRLGRGVADGVVEHGADLTTHPRQDWGDNPSSTPSPPAQRRVLILRLV